MEEKYIYIVFSATPYAIGRAIRRITAEHYNHVSISLDQELSQMYGFARRYYRLPLYGGFVKENISRYRIGNRNARICVCRVSVKADRFHALQAQLFQMHRNQDRYLYNHFSVLTSPFRKRIRLKDAYTCVEFVSQILSQLDILPETGGYRSVGDLEKLLRPHRMYIGPVPEADEFDSTFFSPQPVPHPFLTTTGAFFALFGRIKQQKPQA